MIAATTSALYLLTLAGLVREIVRYERHLQFTHQHQPEDTQR